jgi:predicted RNA-binding Zn-ribbon protein involved in translation (DUF1610 family)
VVFTSLCPSNSCKEKTLDLSVDHFITRILWHVPVKGQHNVRYYGIYVPGAHEQRDLIRAQIGEPCGESYPSKTAGQRTCPECGKAMLHRLSARRKISSIKYANALRSVQQGVQSDRDTTSLHQDWRIYKPPSGFFATYGG